MFDKLFLEHPHSVDESYFEHMGVATSFGARMFIASLACFVHAVVPGFCVRTGSTAIRELHDRMVTNRRARSGTDRQAAQAMAMHGLSGDAI